LPQPGRTTRARVTTIADTSTSTFCLRVVISFPFLTEVPRLADVRGRQFRFRCTEHPVAATRRLSILSNLFVKPCHYFRIRPNARSGVFPCLGPVSVRACDPSFFPRLHLPDKTLILRTPALVSGVHSRQ
jgi:hypothetical protein